jgi:hypothetical protein
MKKNTLKLKNVSAETLINYSKNNNQSNLNTNKNTSKFKILNKKEKSILSKLISFF